MGQRHRVWVVFKKRRATKLLVNREWAEFSSLEPLYKVGLRSRETVVETDVLRKIGKCLVESPLITAIIVRLQQLDAYLEDHGRFVAGFRNSAGIALVGCLGGRGGPTGSTKSLVVGLQVFRWLRVHWGKDTVFLRLDGESRSRCRGCLGRRRLNCGT